VSGAELGGGGKGQKMKSFSDFGVRGVFSFGELAFAQSKKDVFGK